MLSICRAASANTQGVSHSFDPTQSKLHSSPVSFCHRCHYVQTLYGETPLTRSAFLDVYAVNKLVESVSLPCSLPSRAVTSPLPSAQASSMYTGIAGGPNLVLGVAFRQLGRAYKGCSPSDEPPS